MIWPFGNSRRVAQAAAETALNSVQRRDGDHSQVGGASADVREALREVLDPELGYDVVGLGLIYDVTVEEDRARILLTTTTKGCPATAYIQEAVHECAAAVPGIADVEVTLTWDPPWTPERMDDEAKAHFGVPDRGAGRHGE